MKPLQVALLVVVSAVAGGLFMRWQIGRNAAQVAASVPAPPSVPAATPAPAQVPQPVVTQSQPAEPEEPAPVVARKPPKTSAKAHEVLKSHRSAPVVMARNEEPAVVEPAVEAAPAVVQPEPQVTPPAAVAPASAHQPEPEPVVSAPPPAPPPTPLQVTLKAGTLIPARTVEGLSSDRNAPGDGFTATLDQPLVADGWVIAERGAHLEGKVVETGRGKGQSDLVIVLTQLKTSDGQRVPIETETFAKHAQASTGESAAKVVAGAAIGAAIGAIAGGGKGAAIGAGVGTAAGAGGAVATRAKSVVLPAETLVHFRLKNAITITERQARS